MAQKLSADDIWKLLEGHENVLAPLAAKEEEMLKKSVCPSCRGTSATVQINTKQPFSSGSPLANKILHCQGCGVEYDPYSNAIINTPITSESD